MDAMPTIAGLILAGGRGERLGGVIKSGLRVCGVRLLDRVAARLGGCSPLLVAHGRLPPSALELDARFTPVPDLDADYGGPLAGFAAAMGYLAALPARPEFVICAAVDAPFLPEDYVSRLFEAVGSHDVATASYGGQRYPTNSIWRIAAFTELPAAVLAGTARHSLKSLAADSNGVTIEWPLGAAGDPFANINTPADLAEMQRRAAVSPTASRD